jgi:hypothetical protein
LIPDAMAAALIDAPSRRAASTACGGAVHARV